LAIGKAKTEVEANYKYEEIKIGYLLMSVLANSLNSKRKKIFWYAKNYQNNQYQVKRIFDYHLNGS
jgi:hypothetical protein